jgi:CheY-like chemotaxis protein
MTLIIMHSGQSGVERGADRAARTVDFPVGGYCAFEQRDELGALPPEIRASLTPCARKGARSALRATLELSDVLVVAVPSSVQANEVAGIEPLRRLARARGVPHWVVDPITDVDVMNTRIRRMEQNSGLVRVMVTGPRLTRWSGGERLGFHVVANLSLATAARHKILVVDDHVDTAETTRDLLRALGHECVVATSGRSGLEVAETFSPDVALLDLELPDITGYELARQLRSSQTHPLYLAAITGWHKARDSREALAAGFDRHVIKPAGTEIIRGLLADAERQLSFGQSRPHAT